MLDPTAAKWLTETTLAYTEWLRARGTSGSTLVTYTNRVCSILRSGVAVTQESFSAYLQGLSTNTAIVTRTAWNSFLRFQKEAAPDRQWAICLPGGKSLKAASTRGMTLDEMYEKATRAEVHPAGNILTDIFERLTAEEVPVSLFAAAKFTWGDVIVPRKEGYDVTFIFNRGTTPHRVIAPMQINNMQRLFAWGYPIYETLAAIPKEVREVAWLVPEAPGSTAPMGPAGIHKAMASTRRFDSPALAKATRELRETMMLLSSLGKD